jgi:metal-responsive CopG/Arc/MetJ family transcriptional regulator
MTISLPPPLLRQAEAVAQEENRTKSELLREALRFYVETREVRKKASREQLFTLIGRVQSRTRATPSREIRAVIREAVRAARRRALPSRS